MTRELRGIAYWAGGILFTVAVSFVFFLLLPLYGRKPRLPFAITRFWSRVLISGFLASCVDVTGMEFVREGRPYIIVSNHRSYIDILVAQAAFNAPFLWLAKRELFRIPVFGPAMRILGHIPVERERSFAASKALERAEKALRTGASIWVFPEGTRTPLEKLGRFKRGAFVLALRTGTPLLPVAIAGSDAIFQGPFRITPRRVKVIVSPPVPVGGAPNGALSLLIDDVRRTIQSEYDRASSA